MLAVGKHTSLLPIVCRLVPGFSYVGQNMADSWSSVNTPERDLATKVTGWYDEVNTFS